MESLLVSIPDAAAQLAISRSKAYQLVASGELRVVRIGRSSRIRREDLTAWIDAQFAASESRGTVGRSWETW